MVSQRREGLSKPHRDTERAIVQPMVTKRSTSSNTGLGIVLGISIGAAFDNVGVGLVLGICLGAALDARRQRNQDDD